MTKILTAFTVLLIVQYGERNHVRRTAKQSNLGLYGEINVYGRSPYRATFVRSFAVHDFFVLLATLLRGREFRSQPGCLFMFQLFLILFSVLNSAGRHPKP